jgi:hypothetical protein
MTESQKIAKQQQQEAERQLRMRKGLFAESLKKIKKNLPSKCTFLAPYIPGKGEYKGVHMVRAHIGGDVFHYSIPQDFDFTNADIQELHTAILSDCNKEE